MDYTFDLKKITIDFPDFFIASNQESVTRVNKKIVIFKGFWLKLIFDFLFQVI